MGIGEFWQQRMEGGKRGSSGLRVSSSLSGADCLERGEQERALLEWCCVWLGALESQESPTPGMGLHRADAETSVFELGF